MADQELLYLHKGRFRELPGATAKKVSGNTYTVTVPRTDAVHKLVKGELCAEAFDNSIWLIDGEESFHALGTAERKASIDVSVVLP